MDHITNEKVKELARVNEPHSISIFLPTFRAGEEVNELMDRKHLKNLLKKVRYELESSQIKEREIKKLLNPIHKLMDNSGFWNFQSDGLAIFRNIDLFEYYTLPVLFDPAIYVSDHFYPLPLIPYINDEVQFYLLAISMGGVKFFEGFPHQIHEVEVKDLLPERLEEAVGYDFAEKHLNFRSGQDDRGRAIFHGHGIASQETTKIEILKYFRAINDGIMQILHDKKLPLIIAAVDYLVPIYREANDYKYLHPEFIPGNHQHDHPVLLHEKAKVLLKDFFEKDKKEKVAIFEQALSAGKASYSEEAIVPASINGRVDTLFVKKGVKMWGIYDRENDSIQIRDKGAANNTCLLNLAAMHTLLNKGKVYLTEGDDMPEPSSRLNALLRY